MYTITIAWVALDGARETGRFYRYDGVNYKRELELCPRAHAVIWLNSGDMTDVQKAEAHASSRELSDKELVKVYRLPMNETNPLQKSREMIMSEYRG